MPYDVFCTEQAPAALTTTWEFVGTYATLPDARAAITYAGSTRPTLQRWALCYVRRTTTHTGQLHSTGDYPQKETMHA